MPNHQFAVFAEGTRHHLHVELKVVPTTTDGDLRDALSSARTASEDHRTNGNVNVVIGLGPATWDRVRPTTSAPSFQAFPGYESPDGEHRAQSTQADIWLWFHGPAPDVVLDEARKVLDSIGTAAEVVLDQPGFVYHDSRDLTGFIDGTANLFLDEAADAVVVPEGVPGAGGTYAMTMRFVHDLPAFEALPVDAQEAVMGRGKPTSSSLGPDKPTTSHIARAEVADDEGEEMVVYRRSVPFASATEQGLHFVSFGIDLERFDRQLMNMYGLAEDGLVDALLDFTNAGTGSFWFCPGRADLDVIAPLTSGD
ncbi:MAG: Dyp-type peroxidase [Acidimicrobiales bacterium]|nr:Dyp-type peroxidase [Acidimicrobiales bacterium]